MFVDFMLTYAVSFEAGVMPFAHSNDTIYQYTDK